jgi:hypothetical protein
VPYAQNQCLIIAAFFAYPSRAASLTNGREITLAGHHQVKLNSLILSRFRLPKRIQFSISFLMAVILPLERMSRADKLRALEAIWADLSRQEEDVDSPPWHAEALRESEQLARKGKAKFSDWTAASKRLRRNAARRK